MAKFKQEVEIEFSIIEPAITKEFADLDSIGQANFIRHLAMQLDHACGGGFKYHCQLDFIAQDLMREGMESGREFIRILAEFVRMKEDEANNPNPTEETA